MSTFQQLQPQNGVIVLDRYYNNVTLLLHLNGSNGGTTFTDSSLNPSTFTASGNANTSTAQFKFGTASLLLDGTGDWIQSTTNLTAGALGSGDFTVEAWIYPTAATKIIYDFGWTNALSNGWELYINSSRQLEWWRAVAGGLVLTTSTTITLNTWSHVAAVRSNGVLSLYINGTSGGSVAHTLTYNANGVTTFAIGAQVQTRNATYDFNGYIDECRITRGIARYTTNFTPPDQPGYDNTYSKFYSDPDYSSVSLLLHMDGPNGGTTFRDNSPSPKSITIASGATLSTPVTSTTQKKYGVSSAFFDGAGDYLVGPASGIIDFGSGDFTVEGWVYVLSYPDTQTTILSNYGTSGQRGFDVRVQNNGTIASRFSTNGSTDAFSTSSAAGSLNTWQHFAVVRQGSLYTAYLNGVGGTATNIGASTIFAPSSQLLWIGGTPDTGTGLWWYNGYIDDLRITKGVARYTSNFTPPAAPHPNLGVQTNWIDNIYADQYYGNNVLLLHCDGAGSGTTFRDSSPQVNTVTANGNAITSTAATKWGPTSAAFDGTNSFLSLTYSSAFQFGSGNFTIEMWVYPSSTPNGSALYAETYTGTGDEVSLAIGFCNGTLGSIVGSLPFIGFFSGGAWTGAAASSALTNGVWSFLAYVRNGSTHTLYVNGTSVASFTYAGALPTDADGLIIGRRWDTDQPGNSPYFPGYIDDLRVTKGVARYTAAFTPPAAPFPNLAPPGYDPFYQRTSLLLHMDGANGGTTFTDNSPVPKTVTPVGNAVTSTSVVKYGSASAFFDGTGDYLTVTSGSTFNFPGNFTVECWFYPLSRVTLYPTVWANYNSYSNTSLALFAGHAGGNTSKYQVLVQNSNFPNIQSTINIEYNSWQHLAVVRNGSTITLYINGVADGTYTSAANLTFGSTFWIGVTGDSLTTSTVNGYIDELRITEGIPRYAANFQPPTGPFPNR